MLDGMSMPEEMMAYLQKRKEWEVNEGTGLLGEVADNEEEKVLEQTTAHAQNVYDKYQQSQTSIRRGYSERKPPLKSSSVGQAMVTRTLRSTACCLTALLTRLQPAWRS